MAIITKLILNRYYSINSKQGLLGSEAVEIQTICRDDIGFLLTNQKRLQSAYGDFNPAV